MGANEIQNILTELANGRDLPAARAEDAFRVIMNGGATPAQIAAFLLGLRAKGETTEELLAGARVLRGKLPAFQAPEGTLDTCGTGGDGSRTVNISTAVAIVVAACGVPVAKHGNRAVTSASGSADVLEALGLNIRVDAAKAEAALHEIGLTFLMAPLYHKAMRHVADVRKELGLRTIFNLLGPLANPAGARRQLIGVYDAQWLEPVAEVLGELGSDKAWVVHGSDGMDEITLYGPTEIAALENGTVNRFTLDPAEYGFDIPEANALRGGTPEDNALALRALLKGKKGAYRDIVLLNSAAALIVAGRSESIAEAVPLATDALDSGAAEALLARLTKFFE